MLRKNKCTLYKNIIQFNQIPVIAKVHTCISLSCQHLKRLLNNIYKQLRADTFPTKCLISPLKLKAIDLFCTCISNCVYLKVAWSDFVSILCKLLNDNYA